jgi:hypothetical protein
VEVGGGVPRPAFFAPRIKSRQLALWRIRMTLSSSRLHFLTQLSCTKTHIDHDYQHLHESRWYGVPYISPQDRSRPHGNEYVAPTIIFIASNDLRPFFRFQLSSLLKRQMNKPLKPSRRPLNSFHSTKSSSLTRENSTATILRMGTSDSLQGSSQSIRSSRTAHSSQSRSVPSLLECPLLSIRTMHHAGRN